MLGQRQVGHVKAAKQVVEVRSPWLWRGLIALSALTFAVLVYLTSYKNFFYDEWDFVTATLFSHASRVDWLIRTSQSAWSELKWRAEPVELFQMNQHSTMVDLLHALDEFRRLLRTKVT